MRTSNEQSHHLPDVPAAVHVGLALQHSVTVQAWPAHTRVKSATCDTPLAHSAATHVGLALQHSASVHVSPAHVSALLLRCLSAPQSLGMQNGLLLQQSANTHVVEGQSVENLDRSAIPTVPHTSVLHDGLNRQQSSRCLNGSSVNNSEYEKQQNVSLNKRNAPVRRKVRKREKKAE
jgi:hypothetical protein